MAIDQYQPELTKRRMSFEIAYKQLQESMSRTHNILIDRNKSRKTRITLAGVEEAVNDFLEMASSTAEWLNTKVEEPEASEEEAASSWSQEL